MLGFEVPALVGWYPLDCAAGTQDISSFKNKPGDTEGSAKAAGDFFWFENSGRISFPTSKALNTKYDITMSFWMNYVESSSGSIFSYSPTGQGLDIWMSGENTLNVRKGDSLSNSKISIAKIQPNQWHYVAFTYSHATNVSSLYTGQSNETSNTAYAKSVNQKFYGENFTLGQSSRGGFEGYISCLQVYDREITKEDLFRTKYRSRCLLHKGKQIICLVCR